MSASFFAGLITGCVIGMLWLIFLLWLFVWRRAA